MPKVSSFLLIAAVIIKTQFTKALHRFGISILAPSLVSGFVLSVETCSYILAKIASEMMTKSLINAGLLAGLIDTIGSLMDRHPSRSSLVSWTRNTGSACCIYSGFRYSQAWPYGSYGCTAGSIRRCMSALANNEVVTGFYFTISQSAHTSSYRACCASI